MIRLRNILWGFAALMGTVVAARFLMGPTVVGGFSVTTPANPEGFLGLGITILLLWHSGGRVLTRAIHSDGRAEWALAATVAVLAMAAFSPGLTFYFLSDDFILIKMATQWDSARLVPLFTSPGGDGFFRPFGYLSLAFTASWAGSTPWLWHIPALAANALNATLVTLLARRLGVGRLGALVAGALFAVHGTHPEAVVWIAGRFDMLATVFSLGCLLLFRRSTWGALLCCLPALLSKESAYVLPALLTLLAVYERRAPRETLPFWGLATAAFAYRWFLFGGIGGYTIAGRPQFFALGLASTLKALFVRLWTSLYFPLNWSVEPGWVLMLLAVAYIGTLLWLTSRPRYNGPAWVGFAGLLISMLPALHLFNGAPDLAGGRLLYLPSVWFCVMLGSSMEGLGKRAGMIVAAIVLAFHFTALWHNLDRWENASERVRITCEGVARGAIVAEEHPGYIQGVPGLANGFAECVELASRPLQ
ncbi:MAG: hypothetical protein ABI811_02725 [Acidobacteriota bacterium]